MEEKYALISIVMDKNNQEIAEIASQLQSKSQNLNDLVHNIHEFLNNYLKNEELVYIPKSILESRFTPVSVAYKVRMRSCGSVTNIAVEMLRHLDYKVKKVHGNTQTLNNHAWFKVYDTNSSNWIHYDLSQNNESDTAKHNELASCNTWEEIESIIVQAHLELQ